MTFGSKINHKVAYKIDMLKNGSSSNLAVDGSTNSVIYTWQPPSDEIWYLYKFGFFIIDPGTMSPMNFGGDPGLVEGLEIIVNTAAPTTIKNIKTNIDIMMSFCEDVIIGNSTTGFLDTNDYFLGHLVFPIPIMIDGNQNHSVTIEIKDDLSPIDTIMVHVHAYKNQ